MANGPRISVLPCVGPIDGALEARRGLHLPAAKRRGKIERFESRPRVSGKRAADVGIDEVVFHGAQPPCDVIVGDAQLVEALGVRFRKQPQQIAGELLVIVRRLN